MHAHCCAILRGVSDNDYLHVASPMQTDVEAQYPVGGLAAWPEIQQRYPPPSGAALPASPTSRAHCSYGQ